MSARETVDPDSATPVYVQVANILRSRIESGQLLPDRPVPSESPTAAAKAAGVPRYVRVSLEAQLGKFPSTSERSPHSVVISGSAPRMRTRGAS